MSKQAQQADDQDLEDLDSAIEAAFTGGDDAADEVDEIVSDDSSDVVEATEEVEQEESAESEEVETQSVESTETETGEPIEAPAFFNSEEKEAFKTYPREMQQAIDRVASGLRRRVSEDTQKLAPLRRLGDVIAPAIPEMQKLGLTPDQFIGNLIRARAMILQDPIAGLQALGVDTQQLLNGMGQGESDGIPVVLQERLGRVERTIEQQRQAEEAQQYQAQFGMARAFRDEVDQQGRLMRPFLEVDPVTDAPRYPEFTQEVLTQVELLRAGRPATREILDKAYQRALRLSDDAQTILAQKQKAEEVKKRQQALASKKLASSSVGNSNARDKGTAADEYDLDKAIGKLFATV